MKKVILVVSSQDEFLLYDYGIRLTEFQILKVYCAGEKLTCAYPIESIEQIEEVRTMDYDYIINGGGELLEAQIDKLLKCIAPESKIIAVGVFLSTFLEPVQQMKYVKESIKIGYKALLSREDVVVGDYSYGNPEIMNVDEERKLIIGKFCSIAHEVKITLKADHRMDWNTTYPFNEFLPEFQYIKGHPFSKGDIIIGNDVWIGMDTIILSGVTIGDGCVIGAGAVVTNSVPPYCVAAGNPARVVKKRFSDAVIERFIEMQWWNWDDSHIYNAIPLLQSENTDGLYEYYLTHIKNQ